MKSQTIILKDSNKVTIFCYKEIKSFSDLSDQNFTHYPILK